MYREVYRCVGMCTDIRGNIDIWGCTVYGVHIDVQGVYRHMMAYRCTGGEYECVGGHTDVLANMDVLGSYGHCQIYRQPDKPLTCLPTTPEGLYNS